MTQPPFRLSPSLIARYFFQDCDRYLRFRAATRDQARAEGIPAGDFDHSPLMKDVMESGLVWEEKVIKQHLAGKAAIAPVSGRLSERRFDLPETLERLRTLAPGMYLYQGTLQAPPSFYQSLGLDATTVLFADCHPDLIEVVDTPRGRKLRIIDIKRGESVQLVHRIQVLLYAMLLEHVLATHGINDAYVDMEEGGVWLGDHDAPEWFKTDSLHAYLHKFLSDDLPKLLATPALQAFWHYTYNCERCGYMEFCQERMRAENDISRLTNLTVYGKRHLYGLGVKSLEELEAFLRRPDADELLGRCASLAGDRHYLEHRLEALRTGQPRSQGSATALPIGEHVGVFLTLQREPLGRSTYLAGILAQTKRDNVTIFRPEVRVQLFDGENTARPRVFVAPTPQDVDAVRVQFVRLLYQMLEDVHQFNVNRGRTEQLTLQVYTHTDRERDQLTEWLLASLDDPELAVEAMALLLHFQCPDLLHTDEHPDRPVPYPVIVLQNVLTKMVALPIEVSYTLPETLDALGAKWKFQRHDYFHYPLGHGLRSEVIHAVWKQGKTERLEWLFRAGQNYLYAQRSLLYVLRQEVGEHLFGWPPKFLLPYPMGINDPLLSRLAFFTRYEAVAQNLALRAERAEPEEVRLRFGLALELEAVNETEFEVVNDSGLDIDKLDFGKWLLSRAGRDGRRAQLAFRDWASRDKMFIPKSADLALVSVSYVDEASAAGRRLGLKILTAFDGPKPQPGERFVLQARFTDFNSEKVVGFLGNLDGAGGGFFLDVLHDPAAAAAEQPLPAPIEAIAAAKEDRLGLSPSQLAAYRATRGSKLRAVWGPPGTGKTHFLAMMILALAEAHLAAGLPFRVLITAFTHAAIENLQKKVLALGQERGTVVPVGKVKRWDRTPVPGISLLKKEKDMAPWLDEHPVCVLGATVYACLKAGPVEFDLVVLDEASQVRVAEAAVPMSLLTSSGRVVLAGDDKQLPPIVQGVYPQPMLGEPLLHRSIFEAISTRATACVSQLLENRRMNDVLTSYAANLVYGPRYCCANLKIAGQRLRLASQLGADFVSTCLTPDYPLVVVLLDGIQATKQNLVEARLVADVAMRLREDLLDAKGNTYAHDQDFFRHGLFVVSPHRAQNRAIRRELEQRRDWTSAPFVDTVDKMQGQEADAVIVSYGVSDPEYALMESKFIYSMNRLNVAITRARSKCVVFLSRSLLAALPRVVDNPDAEQGLGYMRGLVAAAQEDGRSTAVDLGEGVTATIVQVGSPRGTAAILT